MKSSDIRSVFLDYFKDKGHQIVPSSSLVPGDDPTLLFTNAGMVQFKDVFLGQDKRPYTRAVSSQRCVRAGGKHNDLENVGFTARHHTFFEMLGNFSFGDYFKREAINYAWEFLTGVLKLPKEKLWVTVFENDDESADIWLKEIGVPKERFSRCGEKDNFWSMGDTGPCGPCTEIFYDHGEEIAGGPPGSLDADGDRYIEIWNLVFMQFNRDKEGTLHPLPKPSVDTGMGLERISAVMQGVHNNYDIDIFKRIIEKLQSMVPEADKESPSFKVIADHIRSCAFLMTDGIMPGNEGRGYVLRRILRRAVRHGHKLGLTSPFLAKLIDPLIETMGEAYPELMSQKETLVKALTQEENQFSKTLEQGLRLLTEYVTTLKGDPISGEIAFKLYDTYGFPLDLTQDIAREQNLVVNIEEFNVCMEKQRELSQSAHAFAADYSSQPSLEHASDFHGYELDTMQSSILTLLVDGNEVPLLSAKTKGAVVLNATPFYAESGGQVGDKGQLFGEQAVFQVEDTKKVGQAIIHYGEMLKGEFQVKQIVRAEVDAKRRDAIRLNHTATHLLHAALKHVLGNHVQQKGSLVDAERARFDFSHPEALTLEQIKTIEQLVNDRIRLNDPALTEVMAIEEAKKSGAEALFGEKYADKVRVLSLGDFSKELCGGTHARRTGDIGLFKIAAEYGIASGVRRIEMMTGDFALHWVNQQLKELDNIAKSLRTTPIEANEKLNQLLQTVKQQEKEIQRIKEKLASQTGGDILDSIKKVNGINLLVKHLEGADSQTIRTTLDNLKSRLDNAVIVLYAVDGEKMNVTAGVSKNLLERVPPAGEYVKLLCGKGGGRNDMAQGGGPVPSDLNQRIEQLEKMLQGV